MDTLSPHGDEALIPPQLTRALRDEAAHLFDLPDDSPGASVKAVTLGTGFGKTFRSHIAAAQHLIKAKAEGRSLVVLYVAPLNSQLTIDDKAIQWLKNHDIPVVYNRSDNELKKYDNPLGLFQVLTDMDALKSGGLLDEMCDRVRQYQRGADDADEDEDEVVDDTGMLLKTDRRDLAAARSVILGAYYRIKKLNERRHVLFPEEQEELDKKFVEANNTLLFMVRKVAQTLLSHQDSPVKHQARFRELTDIICPWYHVQQHKLGFISITTSKMLYQQAVHRPAANHPTRITFTTAPLPQLIHQPETLCGLENTEYIFLIDEADEAKTFFEQQLSGALVRGSHITQALGALYREIERFVYRQGAEHIEIEAGKAAGRELGSKALMTDFENLRNYREQLFHDMQRYRESVGRPLTKQQITHVLDDLQHVLYLAVRRHDPGVQSLGAAGLFTHGVSGFLNGERMQGFAVNQYTSRDILIESLNGDPHVRPLDTSLTGLPLADWFEVISEALCLVKAINTPGQYQDLRRPIRSHERPDDLHTAPLSSMLSKLSIKSTDNIFTLRRAYYPDDYLNIKFAFQAPHVIYAFRRAGKGEHNHSLDEETYSPIVPEITYRLCSAEHFLEQLICPKAYADFHDTELVSNQPRVHHAYLISATGGFENNHVGGFVPKYFQTSDYVDYRPMSREDLALASRLQSDNLTYRDARVFALSQQARYQSPLLRELQRFNILKEMQPLANPHKMREFRRAIAVLDAMAGHPVTLHEDPETNEAMAHALRDSTHCALLIVQTNKHLIKGVKQLAQDNSTVRRRSSLSEKLPKVLYLIEGGRSCKPTLLVFYDKDTDKRLAAMREDQKLQLLHNLGLRQFKTQPLSVSVLLSKTAKAKVLIVSAWRSASRGLNFICDNEKAHRAQSTDLDALILAMPSFYSKVFQQADPDKPWKALEHSINQSHRIYEHAALTSFTPLKLGSLSVNAQHHYAGATAFLNKQHLVQQAVDCIQSVGRAERTRLKENVQQYLFINDESLDSYCDAESLLFKPQPELRDCLSALNTQVIEFAKQRRQARAYISNNPMQEEDAQAAALATYHEVKDLMLSDIRRVQEGALDARSAQQLVRSWSAWHCPRILLEPEAFQETLRQTQWPESFISSLYIPSPAEGCHYALAPQSSDHGLAQLLFDADDIGLCAEQGQLNFFQPQITRDGMKVPQALLASMAACYPGNLDSALKKTETLLWRPHLLAEIKGVWGEWLCRAWFHKHFPQWQALDQQCTTQLLERYDEYYEISIDQKKILIAVDAKHWKASTDVHAGNVNVTSAKDKYQQLHAIASALGYQGVLTIYFNSQPQVAEHNVASNLDDHHGIITATGLQRIRDIDVIQPDSDGDDYHPLVDHSLIVNHYAVAHIAKTLKEIANA